MKVLYNWLKEFVPLEISAQETAATLARLGFEIASFRPAAGTLEGVVAAEVQTVDKHPNADRLSLCQVYDGTQNYAVVCGASNVRAGIRVPFARVGATLPNGETLKAAKIRGVESQGMICSAEELGLEDQSEGILVLEPTAPLGTDIRSLLGLDDAMIEIEVTPNRRDALSVLGVARELSAALGLPLKVPEPRARELEIANGITLSNEATDLCPRYIARYIRDVHVGSSPDWMVQRLTRCGIRSINNIVDVTNYVMLELGQPLHAFDAIKLKGRHVKVRRAHEGETMLTLENKTATLKEGMLVIADESRPAALAGIIGGADSSITSETREIVLESAAFLPGVVRKTSRALGISTESAYRFERGTDWNMVAFAARRAAQLILELAGGLGFKPVEYSAVAPVPPTIKLRFERMRRFLGAEIKESTVADLLRRLGCVISTGTGQLAVTVPSWRSDLNTEADLMEELARLQGYDNIPARDPSIRPSAVPEDPWFSFERRLGTELAGLGFSECINSTFLSRKQASLFLSGLWEGENTQSIEVANPLSQEQEVLRRSLVPGLLQTALLNFNRRAAGLRLFELGRVFHRTDGKPVEQRRLGLLLAGTIRPPHWREKARSADFYELAGSIETLLKGWNIPNLSRKPLNGTGAHGLHPKKSCLLFSGSMLLGCLGEIHPDVAAALDTAEPLVVAELGSEALQALLPGTSHYKPYSPFPPVLRDLSVVTPAAVPYERIAQTVRSAAGAALESLSLIDLYHGEKIGADRRSLTMSLLFRQPDRTLSDADIEKVMHKVVAELERKCEAVLRK